MMKQASEAAHMWEEGGRRRKPGAYTEGIRGKPDFAAMLAQLGPAVDAIIARAVRERERGE